ncbi:DUF3048 domain-containing protein [Alkalicella caledoniensis]|uniref:DUF3048 domain-containing protein n=1 Tax=Alkalicella caledoniensis TaxID=2731377 RepID=A0A7G9W8Q7_ALKCA|nr:DUF3048 domain-containing protein [Alkalicella caledoniensis]QNO15069.1 DUF3048 domain-containing protein [Alkalicella caledoniensis]
MRRLISVLILTAVLFLSFEGVVSNTVYGNTGSPQGSIDDIKKEIAELEETIKLLNEDIDSRLKRIDDLDKELIATEKELEKNGVLLAQAQERLDENTKKFGGRVRSAYMKGGSSYIEILLEADNFGDLIVRLAYLTRVLNRDAELVSGIREEREIIEGRQIAMEDQRKKIEDRRFQMEAERRNLEDQRKAVNALLAISKGNLADELAVVPQAERTPVYGVVFDNHPSARPQHGLSQASIVYEYEVEGRSTRYLVLFSTLPSKVGPIRSAREHSTALALENKVNFIHAGGSKAGMEKISEWSVNSTNALAHPAFYRDSSRRAPHNLYVNLSTLNRGSSSSTVIRPGNLSRQGISANSTSIEYSPSYRVSYQYNSEKGAYKRLINGNDHRDATGAQIWARNIIIQYTAHPTVNGLPTPEVVGQGAIDYYAKGQHFRGTWRKDSPSSRTRFYYEDGQEIERIYGQTWIQISRPK